MCDYIRRLRIKPTRAQSTEGEGVGGPRGGSAILVAKGKMAESLPGPSWGGARKKGDEASRLAQGRCPDEREEDSRP